MSENIDFKVINASPGSILSFDELTKSMTFLGAHQEMVSKAKALNSVTGKITDFFTPPYPPSEKNDVLRSQINTYFKNYSVNWHDEKTGSVDNFLRNTAKDVDIFFNTNSIIKQDSLWRLYEDRKSNKIDHKVHKISTLHCDWSFYGYDRETFLMYYKHVGSPSLISVSDTVKENFKTAVPEIVDRIRTVPNSVDTVLYKQSSEEQKISFKRKLGIPEEDRLVGFSGRLDKLKGVDVLFRTIANIKKEDNLTFLLAAPPSTAIPFRISLKKLYPEIYNSGKVKIVYDVSKFPGLTDEILMQELKIDAYSGQLIREPLNNFLDAFAFTSITEGFGISILEAMCSSNEITVYDTELMRWLLKKDKFYLKGVKAVPLRDEISINSEASEEEKIEIYKEDGERFYEAILYLLDHKVSGVNPLRERVLEKYSPSVVGGIFLNALNEIGEGVF